MSGATADAKWATPFRVCSLCGQVKGRCEFYRSAGYADGYTRRCIDCTKAKTREREMATPGIKAVASRRAYWKDPEKARARSRRSSARYRATWDEREKAVKAAYMKAYRSTEEFRVRQNARLRERYAQDPHVAIESAARRRARIKGAPSVERIDRAAIIKRDGSKCWMCSRKLPLHEVTLDHLIPLAQGGPHTPANLRVACRPCNSSRGVGRVPAQMILEGVA